MASIRLVQGQEFTNRAEISELLGGNPQSGITLASNSKAILLFKNEEELYSDYFYPRGSYDYCMYTGNHENNVYINLRGLVTGKRKKKVLDMLLSYCPNAIYGDLDGAGGDYLEKMRKTDIHDIPHSPYYTGNNT